MKWSQQVFLDHHCRVRRHDECFVAAGFDAKEWAAKRRITQLDAILANAIERFANGRRHDEPGTPRRCVEWELRSVKRPVHRRLAAMNHRQTRKRWYAVTRWLESLPSCHDHRWIHRRVEELPGLGHVVQLDELGFVKEMRAQTATGKRSPELGRNEKRHGSTFARQGDGSLDEQC